MISGTSRNVTSFMLRALVVLDTSKSRAVEQWNSAHPEQKIEAGHVILEVNGARDPRRMLRQLRKSSKVEILMNKQPSPEQVCVFQAALELRRKPALPTVEEGLEVTSPCASVEPCLLVSEGPKAAQAVTFAMRIWSPRPPTTSSCLAARNFTESVHEREPQSVATPGAPQRRVRRTNGL
ncbi:unnamed protein product [Durusdinium trenchii]|uniref:Uncharacterized protein n=1 Tax=Durusdinium trenchii TaxID=1381693 RepID=A0ABP0MAQ0_9DINO